MLVLILTALSSKLVGAGLAARLSGMDRSTSLAVGTAMSSRGAVELIIAEIALRAGLFTARARTAPSDHRKHVFRRGHHSDRHDGVGSGGIAVSVETRASGARTPEGG